MPEFNFASDNTAAVAPRVMEALVAANVGRAMPYGADDWSRRLTERMSEVFERRVAVFPVSTGSAANGLTLSALTRPYGVVFCHEKAHVHVDECAGPEFFTGGSKVVPLPGAAGRIEPTALIAAIEAAREERSISNSALSLTNLTEAGTCYTPDALAELTDIAHRSGMGVHLDGARFANAVAALGCTPAEASWKAGVDILAFGGTKNGCLAAEALVVFDPEGEAAAALPFLRHRGGQIFSKARYFAAQFLAYLEDGAWLADARHANREAARLAAGLGALPEVELLEQVEGNEIFLTLPTEAAERLKAAGFGFYDKPAPGQPGRSGLRLVLAFDSDPAASDALLEVLRQMSAIRAVG